MPSKPNVLPRAVNALRADPLEKHNIYRPDHPLLAEFQALIAERMSQIPKIPDARVAAAFRNVPRKTQASE